MYGIVLFMSLSFSSKNKVNKSTQVNKKSAQINKSVQYSNKSSNLNKPEICKSYSEGFYFPVISFNKVKENNSFYSFHFEGKKEIFPVRKGIVLFVGKEKDLPGYTIVLYHSPNYISLYSNLEEVKAVKGDLIKNIFEPMGIANKSIIFSIRKNIRDNVTEKVDMKKLLKKRDNQNKT